MGRDEYDCELNSVGYMLAKMPDGDFLRGAAWSQAQDPWTQHISQEERWKRVSFGFRDGAGARKFDGTPRYSHGSNVDSHSGNLVTGPFINRYMSGPDLGDRVRDIADVGTAYSISTGGAANDGVAVRFTTAAAGNVNISHVNILVARNPGVDYRAAAVFVVEVWTDVADKPGVMMEDANVSLKTTEEGAIWFENRWLGSDEATDAYFWLTVLLAEPLPNDTQYWLAIRNVQAPSLYWAAHDSVTAEVCYYNGAAWGAKATRAKPFYQINYNDRIDGAVQLIYSFTGVDESRKIYAASGTRLWVLSGSGAWSDAGITASDRIEDLGTFGGGLLVALRGGADLRRFDGTTLTTVWTTVTGEDAQCLALHDNLFWKAYGAEVMGSDDGTTWGHNTVEVGDPASLVCRMISHGGRLYAVKAEGVFEISYPDTYPTTGTPECNQVLDFKTDLAPRPFALDWHSGLYFPGSGGAALYEWKEGVLRDVWRERISDDETESLLPLHDSRHGVMMACCGTTRGLIVALSTPYVNQGRSQIYFYDDRGWHPIIQGEALGEPIMAVHLESKESGVATLYWGEGLDVFYTDWPTWTDDRRDDSEAEFWYDTGAEEDDRPIVFLPEFDDGRPDMLKDWYKVRIRSDNAGTGGTEGGRVRVAYSINDAAYVNLGYLDDSPTQDLTFPANTTGYKIQFRMRWECPQNKTYALTIEAVDLFFQPLPDTIGQHRIWILAAKNIEKHNNTIDQRSGKEIYETLKALEDETEPWTYKDEMGISQTVRAMTVSKEATRRVEADSGDGTGFRVEALVQVTMLEV